MAAPISRNPGEGQQLWVLGDLYTFKARGADTGGAVGVFEGLIYPQNGPPPHIHLREDESFWVLDGDFEFLKGDQSVRLSAGGFFHVPKNNLHTFKNVGGAPGRLLILLTPAGFEEFFFEIGEPVTDPSSPPPVTPETIQKLMALAPKYHLEIPG